MWVSENFTLLTQKFWGANTVLEIQWYDKIKPPTDIKAPLRANCSLGRVLFWCITVLNFSAACARSDSGKRLENTIAVVRRWKWNKLISFTIGDYRMQIQYNGV